MNALIFLMAAFGLGGCNMEMVRASGDIVSETVSVGTFDAIDASNGIKVYLNASTAGDGTIEIVADDNIHKHIRSYVAEGELVLELAENISIFGGTIKVYVNNDAVSSLEGSGGSLFECSGVVSGRKLDIDLSGGSRFAGEVGVDEMDVDISGGSAVDVEGVCGRFLLDSSGGSRVSSYNLTVTDSSLDISGGGRVEQTIVGTMSVGASGGSTVRYKGNPQILSINVSGGSTVKKTD